MQFMMIANRAVIATFDVDENMKTISTYSYFSF
jgi:hypothetical protein